MAALPARSDAAVPGRLEILDRLDSTNDEALRRFAAGTARHGDAIVARMQSAGRGRRGRRWQSPAGNLHLTVMVRGAAGRMPGQLAFVAAVALGELLAGRISAPGELRYKWPNDILLGGRKVAGILIEGDGHATADGWWAVGIGVNVAAAPADAAWPATALSASAPGATADDLAEPVRASVLRWYDRWIGDGFAPVRAAWLERAHGIGEPVEARLPDGSTLGGIFRDLDGDGVLMLDTSAGPRRIAAGDVFFPARSG